MDPKAAENAETNSESLGRNIQWTKVFLHPAYVPVIIVLGLVVRVIVPTIFPAEPMSDSAWYVARARELASGLGYQEDGLPTAYWPVGWPAILAGGYMAFGSMALTVVALNTVAALATMFLILWYSRNVAGNELAGRIALLAYAIYPNHVAYIGNAASETVYTALAMAAFALMIKGRDRFWLLVISGCVFGVAALVKPQTLAFPIGAAIALALVYRSFSWSAAARAVSIVYLAIFLIVSPWSYRNLLVLGEPVLVSTNGGTALLLGANDQVTGDHFDYQHTPVFDQLGIPWEDRVARQVELNMRQKHAAIDWIKRNTGAYIAWMPKKVFLLWFKDSDGFWAYDNSYPNAAEIIRVLKISNQFYYIVIIVLSIGCGVIGIRGLLRRHEDTAKLGLLFCMPIFVSLLAAAFTGQIRYHFAAMPFLIVAAGWAVVQIGGWRLNREISGHETI